MQEGKGGSQGEREGKGWRKGASHQTIRRPHEKGAVRGESPNIQCKKWKCRKACHSLGKSSLGVEWTSARPRLQLRTEREREREREREFVDCGINRNLRRKGGGNRIGGGRPTKRGHANRTARSGTDLETPTSILREILRQSGGA